MIFEVDGFILVWVYVIQKERDLKSLRYIDYTGHVYVNKRSKNIGKVNDLKKETGKQSVRELLKNRPPKHFKYYRKRDYTIPAVRYR